MQITVLDSKSLSATFDYQISNMVQNLSGQSVFFFFVPHFPKETCIQEKNTKYRGLFLKAPEPCQNIDLLNGTNI